MTRFRQMHAVCLIVALAAAALVWAAPANAQSCDDEYASEQSGCAPAASEPTDTGAGESPDGTSEDPGSPVTGTAPTQEPAPPATEPASQSSGATGTETGGDLFEPSYGGSPSSNDGAPSESTPPAFETAQSDCDEYDEAGVDCGGLDPGGDTETEPPATAAGGGDDSSSAGTSDSDTSGSEETSSEQTGSSDTVEVSASSPEKDALPATGLGLGGLVLTGVALLGAGRALRRRAA